MPTYQPGDILLVRDYSGGSDVLGNLILAGERARYGNSDWARWTHSALIVSTAGDLVEALADGVAKTNVLKYATVETLVISPKAPAAARAFAVRFAEAQVGAKYDRLDFIALAFSLLTGLKVSVHADGRFICSGLVALATWSYTDHGYPYPPEQCMPSDLGAAFGALSGEPLPPLSLLARLLDKVAAIGRAISPF